MAFHAHMMDFKGGGASRLSISCCESGEARKTVRRAPRKVKRGSGNQYVTGGLDHPLFVSHYLVALPKPEQLEQLIETDRAAWEQHHPNPSPRGDQT